MSNSPPPSPALSYSPPYHLLTHFTAAELTAQFQVFLDSLRYAKNAPELVFERLVGSLNHGFDNTAKQGHDAAEQLRSENKALRASVDALRMELAALRATTGVRADALVAQASSISDPTPAHTALALPPTISPSEDLIRLVFQLISTTEHVRVICKTSTSAPPVHPGRCTWKDVAPPDPELQSGTYVFRSTSSGGLIVENIRVELENAFIAPPTVLVWLTHINYTNGPLLLCVSAVGASPNSFNLRIKVEKGSVVREAGVAWVAYSHSRPDTASKSLDTRTDRNRKRPQFQCSGVFQFLNIDIVRLLVSGGRSFAAMSMFDREESKALTLGAKCVIRDLGVPRQARNQNGWEISMGPKDTGLYSAGLLFLLTY